MAGAQPRIYHCPSCGGPASDPKSRVCEFCEGPLVPMGTPDPRTAVRCGACAVLVGEGASYCSSCGEPLAEAVSTPVEHRCPACPGQTMERFQLQPTPTQPHGYAVHGCRRCGGVWVDRDSLDVMIESAANVVTGDGRVAEVKRRPLSMTSTVVYRACGVCQTPMNRRNFARVSGVIVDECRVHGTFFDAGELEDVLAFVRSGGLLLARRRQNEALAREKRQAQRMERHPLMQPVRAHSDGFSDSEDFYDLASTGLDLAFVRWAGRWIRNMFR